MSVLVRQVCLCWDGEPEMHFEVVDGAITSYCTNWKDVKVLLGGRPWTGEVTNHHQHIGEYGSPKLHRCPALDGYPDEIGG